MYGAFRCRVIEKVGIAHSAGNARAMDDASATFHVGNRELRKPHHSNDVHCWKGRLIKGRSEWASVHPLSIGGRNRLTLESSFDVFNRNFFGTVHHLPRGIADEDVQLSECFHVGCSDIGAVSVRAPARPRALKRGRDVQSITPSHLVSSSKLTAI